MSILDKALQALFNMAHKKTLWKNASPASSFSEQTVNLNWKIYKELRVVIAWGSGNAYVTECTIPIGTQETYGMLNSDVAIANRYLYVYGRRWELTDDGLKLGSGYYHDTAINTAIAAIADNMAAVPLSIYGIRA